MKILKIAVLGKVLAGRTEFIKRLGQEYSCSVEYNSTSSSLRLRLSLEVQNGRVDFELMRLGLTEAIHSSSLANAMNYDPRVQGQADFLARADGVVFLLDGQTVLEESNLEAWQYWQRLADEIGSRIDRGRTLFLINKVDLPKTSTATQWGALLGLPEDRFLEISAVTGRGISDVLPALIRVLS